MVNQPKPTHVCRAPPVHIDQTVSDFDGVTFHISTPETKTQILVSLQIRCYKELVQYGAEDVLQREYGQYVAPPETGYNFSVLVDLENLPAEKGESSSSSSSSLSSCCLLIGCGVLNILLRGTRRADQQDIPTETQCHGRTFRTRIRRALQAEGGCLEIHQ
jgi:hypothetical protein